MPLLINLTGEAVGGGDILRLPDDYSTGPGGGPVDLLFFDVIKENSGPGLLVASGIKAGATFCIFPAAGRHPVLPGLSVDWLIANWNEWFVYTRQRDRHPPVDEARILRWNQRTLPEEL